MRYEIHIKDLVFLSPILFSIIIKSRYGHRCIVVVDGVYLNVVNDFQDIKIFIKIYLEYHYTVHTVPMYR